MANTQTQRGLRVDARFSLLLGFLVIWLAPSGLFGQDLQQTGSNLPIVILNTAGQAIPADPKITADMTIVYRGPGQRTYPSDAGIGSFVDYAGKIGIEQRGNLSASWPKKQYGVETRDAAGNNLNVSLLGLPAENDWILQAPYHDKSLMRNVLAYDIARKMGRYASRTVFVEVILNGQYQGLYVLMEKIKQDKNRVDISKLDFDDIYADSLTGGYIVKQDFDGENAWTSPYGNSADQKMIYGVHDPVTQDLATQQRTYIESAVTAFETSVWNSNYADPVNGWRSKGDESSFVDYIMLYELSKNSDAFRRSVYYHKDRTSEGGKLMAGPVWDFNHSFANVFTRWYGSSTANWNTERSGVYIGFHWPKIFNENGFERRFANRWWELRQGILSNAALNQFIDETASYLGEAAGRNFQRWNILGKQIPETSPSTDVEGATSRTSYAAEVAWMKNWITNRLAWMDANIQAPQPCAAPLVISEINYNSPTGNNGGDWIEIHNPTNSSVSLGNWKFSDTDGTSAFTIPFVTIPANGYRVVVENVTTFTPIHPTVSNYVGSFVTSGIALDNGGERLVLTDPTGCVADEVGYDDIDPWPLPPDGTGFTLELVDLAADNATYSNWQSSGPIAGTPGQPNSSGPASNPCAVTPPDVYINEIMYAAPTGAGDDWIELYNNSGADVDLSGWYFKDSGSTNAFAFKPGTSLSSDGYLVTAEELPEFQAAYPSVSNVVGSFNFGLKSSGEQLRLYSPSGCLVDQFTYSAVAPWPTGAIDSGFSIGFDEGDNGQGSNWLLSEEVGGTPREANFELLPVVTLTAPADGASYPQNETIAIIAQNLSDPSLSVANIKIYANGSFAGTATRFGATQSWILNRSFQTPGTYSLVARVTDSLGQTADSAPVTITITEVFVRLSSRLILQGAWNGTEMSTSLNDNNLLPLQSPYVTNIGVTVPQSFFDNHPEIVDWVAIELRTGLAKSTRVKFIPAFLTKDGSLMSYLGQSLVKFSGVPAGQYYVVVHHRNHLAIVSPSPVDFSSTSGSIDFTNPQ